MAFICKHVSNHCSLKHSTTQIHANVALVFLITSSSKPFVAWIFHQAHLYRRKTSIIFDRRFKTTLVHGSRMLLALDQSDSRSPVAQLPTHCISHHSSWPLFIFFLFASRQRRINARSDFYRIGKRCLPSSLKL